MIGDKRFQRGDALLDLFPGGNAKFLHLFEQLFEPVELVERFVVGSVGISEGEAGTLVSSAWRANASR